MSAEITEVAERLLASRGRSIIDGRQFAHDVLTVATFARDAAERLAAAEAEVERLRDAGDLMDRMIGAALIPITDCNEACDHPACHLLRARARWRRESTAALAQPDVAGAEEVEHLDGDPTNNDLTNLRVRPLWGFDEK